MHLPSIQVRAGRFVRFLVLPLLLLGLPGCQSEEPPASYVARVGNQYLTHEDLRRKLKGLGPTPDSTEARQQVIDQWVTRMLLYQEALRLNLPSVEEVQRKLERQRRSALITAVTNRMYEQADLSPSEEDVRTYFEQHKDRLRLREPYVDIRYLATDSSATAQAIRQKLSASLPASAWRDLVRVHAVDSTRALRLSRRVLPERRLSRVLPLTLQEINALDEGDVTSIVEAGGRHHLLQLLRRFPAGTAPKLSWFEDEIRRRLRIRARKQMYAREVQRLRSQARASGALELP